MYDLYISLRICIQQDEKSPVTISVCTNEVCIIVAI